MLSGSETAVRIKCNVPRAAERQDRPTDQDLQAVCCRCLDILIGSSAVQVCVVVRSAYHPFATGRCILMELVARRPSITP